MDSRKHNAITCHGKAGTWNLVGIDTLGPSIRSDAVFRIYSMTKPIATVAVMQLTERGKLRADDAVSKYIPAFAQRAGV